MTRVLGWGWVSGAVVLCATAEAVYARPMDAISVVWFAALAGLSAVAAGISALTLVRAFRAEDHRETLDQLYGIAFLVLPASGGLFAAALWTLCWHFLGWD